MNYLHLWPYLQQICSQSINCFGKGRCEKIPHLFNFCSRFCFNYPQKFICSRTLIYCPLFLSLIILILENAFVFKCISEQLVCTDEILLVHGRFIRALPWEKRLPDIFETCCACEVCVAYIICMAAGLFVMGLAGQYTVRKFSWWRYCIKALCLWPIFRPFSPIWLNFPYIELCIRVISHKLRSSPKFFLQWVLNRVATRETIFAETCSATFRFSQKVRKI